ncbi:hypothetical protein D3C78_1913610 [compost metagenome]
MIGQFLFMQALGRGDQGRGGVAAYLDAFLAAVQIEQGEDFQLGNQFGGEGHGDS